MRRSLPLALSALVLAACGSPEPPSPAPTARPAAADSSRDHKAAAMDPATSQTAPARPQTTPSTPAPATAAATPAEFQAAGVSRLVLELSAPYELAGLELHLSFDPALFKAGKADTSGPLSDHMCMDNPNIPGGYKCICAQVVDLKTVSGRVLSVPISWSSRPPTMADLTVEKVMLVDKDSKPAPEGVELKYRLE